MKDNLALFIVLLLSATNVCAQRNVTDFNENWKFILDDNAAFSAPDFQEDGWATLNIPHDWAFQNGIRKDGDQKQGGGYCFCPNWLTRP